MIGYVDNWQLWSSTADCKIIKQSWFPRNVEHSGGAKLHDPIIIYNYADIMSSLFSLYMFIDELKEQ